MSSIASEISYGYSKLKQLEEHRTLAKDRLKLLEQRSREIREMIADGSKSSELAIGLENCQNEIKKTHISLTRLKLDIRRWTDTLTALEKNAIDDMRNNGGNMISVDLPILLILKDIDRLKSRYSDFSSDPTRVNSMRLMAAQFTQELDGILKRRAA